MYVGLSRLYVTRIKKAFACDVFFPVISSSAWATVRDEQVPHEEQVICLPTGGRLHWYRGVRYYGRAGLFGGSLDCALQSPPLAVSLCPHYHAVGYGQSE